MGDDHQRALALQQVVGQPAHALDVEVVGRFVEHQQVEVAHQRGGQRDAAALAAGKIGDRGVQAEPGHAEAGEHRPHPRVGGPFVLGAETVRVEDRVAHGRVRGKLGALGDHRHPQIATLADPAAVRLGETGEHLQQRRLAPTVEPDDADALARRDTQRNAVQQRTHAVALADRFQIDQVHHRAFVYSINCVAWSRAGRCPRFPVKSAALRRGPGAGWGGRHGPRRRSARRAPGHARRGPCDTLPRQRARPPHARRRPRRCRGRHR